MKSTREEREDAVPRIGLVLDLDENLMSVDFIGSEKSRSYLSSSAQLDLSKSDDGNILNANLIQNMENIQATAHRRTDWKALLERVHEMNKQHKTMNPDDNKPLINVFIFTAGNYDLDGIRSTLAAFYNDKENKFLEDLIPLSNIFNRERIREIVCLHPNIKGSTERMNTLFKGLGFEKAVLMDLLFHHKDFKEKYGICDKKNILLVDDQDKNIKHFEKHGFLAVLNPTNIVANRGRPQDVTYTNAKESVFAAINQLIDKAQAHIDSQSKGKAHKKSKTIPDGEDRALESSPSKIRDDVPDNYQARLRSLGLFDKTGSAEPATQPTTENNDDNQKKRKK